MTTPSATPEVQRILNALLTAEKIELTLYVAGLRSGVLADLAPDDLSYFQAATNAEFVHMQMLQGLGASNPVQNQFWYPLGTLTDRSVFLDLLERLETAGVGAYSAAIFRFAGDLRRPDLALLAARILGTEAEHRVLARLINQRNPPDDVCLEAVPTLNFATIEQFFAPFLSPNQFGGASVGGIPLPDAAMVAAVAGGNGCRMTTVGQ